ncbi:MAG: Rpn family recombination-promoting nuclease/putative transposase [Acidobacteria bacterium]|nr:Rpn family recombination-promoting nuclease/putative transposase [Acidobacteriota bacterium]
MNAHPHDALFRRTFGKPEHAASLLRTILPARAVEQLDLAALQASSASFVDPELAQSHADLLFTVPLAGREALVYLLIEHQSEVDPLMALRVLRYVVRVIDDWLGRNRGATVLPPVVPIVVYHGRDVWTAATDVRELFGVPELLREELWACVPSLRFRLEDLARGPDAAPGERGLTAEAALTLQCLKHLRRERDLRQFVVSRMWLMRLVCIDDPAAIDPFMMYLVSVRGDDIDLNEFAEIFRAGLGGPAGDRLMTIAERLIHQGLEQGMQQGIAQGMQQGIAQGMQQGIAQGMQQGLLEGARGLLLEQLTELFGEPPGEVVARINAGDLVQVRRWSRAVLRAASLDEVFSA